MSLETSLKGWSFLFYGEIILNDCCEIKESDIKRRHIFILAGEKVFDLENLKKLIKEYREAYAEPYNLEAISKIFLCFLGSPGLTAKVAKLSKERRMIFQIASNRFLRGARLRNFRSRPITFSGDQTCINQFR